MRRARTNTDREGDTGDGRAATGSRGAVDDNDDYYDHDDHDDVQTGRIGARNETDCDGAVVALLVSNARICVRVCVRGARSRDVVVMVTVVGARVRKYVDPPPPNSIVKRATCAPAPIYNNIIIIIYHYT